MRPRLFFPPPVHAISLKIGQFEFYGRGLTRQLARHDAAAKAVRVLQQIYEKSLANAAAAAASASSSLLSVSSPQPISSLPPTTTATTTAQQENCSLIANEEHRLRQIDEFFTGII